MIDDIYGRELVDEWKDRDGFLRRRIIYGRVSISENCTEKINFFERNEKKGKSIDRKVGGSIRAVAEEGGGCNKILEEVMEDGELVPVLEILGEVVFKRDDLGDKLMLGESVGLGFISGLRGGLLRGSGTGTPGLGLIGALGGKLIAGGGNLAVTPRSSVTRAKGGAETGAGGAKGPQTGTQVAKGLVGKIIGGKTGAHPTKGKSK
jgi:hypothetical protein